MATQYKSNIKKNSFIGGISATIIAIISAVVITEGGYVNDARDPGGETNHGITKVVAVNHGYRGPMNSLTKEQANEIYFESYIKKPGFLPLVELSPAIGEKLIDASVNIGPARPSRWFQLALNSLNRDGKDYPTIAIDGRVGPNTVNTYRSLVRVRGRIGACQAVLKMMDAQQTMHYMGLTNLKVYTYGWMDNRIGNVPLSKCKEIYVQPSQ